MQPRKSDFTKPEDLTFQQWLIRLESDRRDLLAQMRRQVHTRGFTGGAYLNKLDRAICFAKSVLAN
jgi:hypothetical protein